jgi:uncharacterized protein YjbI with pentapeptide repeats
LVGKNLVGKNLVGKNLVGKNLVGKNLVGKNLVGKNLVHDKTCKNLSDKTDDAAPSARYTRAADAPPDSGALGRAEPLIQRGSPKPRCRSRCWM